MSHPAVDRDLNPDPEPVDAKIHRQGRQPWQAPLVITATAAQNSEKFSVETFEGGSYPTTHGPS